MNGNEILEMAKAESGMSYGDITRLCGYSSRGSTVHSFEHKGVTLEKFVLLMNVMGWQVLVCKNGEVIEIERGGIKEDL